MSEAPDKVESYTSGELWAGDVAAVIAQRGLERPVIVAWSYGGYVVSDYLSAHGDGAIAGVNYVGWSVVVGRTGTAFHRARLPRHP